jgi:two-component system NtrC family sensor kinase
MEPTLEMLDLNQVVKESFSFVEKEARFHNLAVELKPDSSLPLILADRAQLQQVLLNLFNNALDAAGQGGKLVIATTRDGDFLQARVTDSGAGVPPEVGARVFDPFFTTKAPGQGTGLGLSISHSIMEKMGGTLTFESPPGQGATFIASLPIVGSETG